jgi:hypothetical protein
MASKDTLEALKEYFDYKQGEERNKALLNVANIRGDALIDSARVRGATVGNKLLPSSLVSELSGYDKIKKLIPLVQRQWKDYQSKLDPSSLPLLDQIQGKLGGGVKGTVSEEFLNAFKPYAQSIGVGMEGGKLTDPDFEKYQQFLPQLGDTDEIVTDKLRRLQEMSTESYDNLLRTSKEAGYSTGALGQEQASQSTTRAPSSVTPDLQMKARELLMKRQNEKRYVGR